MSCFDELRAVVTKHNLLGDFPYWLLKEVLEIADAPDHYGKCQSLVTLLTTQISDYDAFAGAGCFGEAVSADTIRMTIRKIKAEA